MLVIPGSSAISDFRKIKALEQLQKSVPDCVEIEAHFLFIADLAEPLTQKQMGVVASLLNLAAIAPVPALVNENRCVERIVVPRIGTISPWATKATDIFHHCGLDQVKRIERVVRWKIGFDGSSKNASGFEERLLAGVVFDPMTESILDDVDKTNALFHTASPAPLVSIDILNGGLDELKRANQQFGFALSDEEQVYLVDRFRELERNPTDVELMMFAQVNSEHCRHKIFNADWDIDGVSQDQSLFSMIRHTHKQNGRGTLSAYSDNAAALEGSPGTRFAPNANSRRFETVSEPIHFTAKVETHNHPTAISPFAGASTGSGGEIRDEGATGRGGKPKAGLVGYSVSHLRIPGATHSWELPENKPERIASPLQIMLEGPIGAAAFNNEFGRPNIAGYFRSFEQVGENQEMRFGYHKPIMLAGGLGNIRPDHVEKNTINDATPIVVLGGPTMLIGLGGGAASSVASGASSESLDFASVQRGNPEMQRRCQEVIDACCAMGKANPIVSIHDVGAGGICNALPELVNDSESGGQFELRNVLNDEPGMSPMQIWCNESQERYVLAINPNQFDEFVAICKRERCLFAQVGVATKQRQLVLHDEFFAENDTEIPDPIDLPMSVLFGLPPKMHRKATTVKKSSPQHDFSGLDLAKSIELVLGHPTVGDKTFLVTIGDRSVTGLIARDQMVGPWQVPVADVAVTSSGYTGVTGEAFAIGERTPLAILDGPASGRMAIGEVITNIAAAKIENISDIKLSANWMVAAGEDGQDADLYATVKSIGLDICPDLGISIPVGKDSMSMKTVWQQDNQQHKVVSPLSLVVSGFSKVSNVRKTLTPVMDRKNQNTEVWLLDLGAGKNRLGGSILSEVISQKGGDPPDLDDTERIKHFFEFIQKLNQENLILSYHDRSDGGLMATLCEMAFASRSGLAIELNSLAEDVLAVLFNEELGAVIQIDTDNRQGVLELARSMKLESLIHHLGRPVKSDEIEIKFGGEIVFSKPRQEIHQIWSQTTWQMQRLRDNPDCADQEYTRILDLDDPGLFCNLSFTHSDDDAMDHIAGFNIGKGVQPKIAILREQGVNGQLEMAAAFHAAGFDAMDVTMSDLANGTTLDAFKGFAACGGFSFGDVLGAGEGWGKSILFNQKLKDLFEQFFNRPDTFSLGVCNGCQMMSSIKEIIPGAEHWPRFLRNNSEQYEARYVMVEVCSEKSILFDDMMGSKIPVSVAHGEGRVSFESLDSESYIDKNELSVLRFIDNYANPATTYPYNPNGSTNSLTGFTNHDGRSTIMMPHPERVFRTQSSSWHPSHWGEYSPWIKIFQNARKWVE